MASQVQQIEQMFNPRAESYNDSWHPKFATDMVSWASISPYDQVLDLGCGTGLVSLAAASIIKTTTSGTRGFVVGIDVTDNMLKVARKAAENQGLSDIVSFIKHDIAQLHLLENPVVLENSFDVITCCSCLTYLPDPAAGVAQWSQYLKPGGRLIVDVPGARDYISGAILERVATELGSPIPWQRAWIHDMTSLEELVISAGLKIERAFFVTGYRESKSHYPVEDGEKVFETLLQSSSCLKLRNEGQDFVEKVKTKCLQYWHAQAENDVVHEEEGSYVVIGRKL